MNIKSEKNETSLSGVVVVVGHQKGGVGKSTLAYNSAIELQKRLKEKGLSVELIDLDMQQTITDITRIREALRFKELLDKEHYKGYGDKFEIEDEDGFDLALREWVENYYLPNEEEESVLLRHFDTPVSLEDHLRWGHENGVVSIIDVGGFDSDFARLSIGLSDILISPLSENTVEVLGLKKYEKVIRDVSEILETHIVSKVVANKMSPSRKKFDDFKNFVTQSPHFKAFETILRARVAYDKAISFGKSVIEHNEDEKAVAEFSSFLDELEHDVISFSSEKQQ